MFKERPLVSQAGKKRSLVAGVGINDARYVTGYTDENGKKITCPYYATWSGMLERVFSPNFHLRQPTYLGCTVDESWKVFTNFRKWMHQQDWHDKCLDKDLLVLGNKHYGPDTCMFVSKYINSLTVLRGNARGAYPLGVVKSSSNGYTYFLAKCSFYGKQKTLGSFSTPEEASEAYLIAKRTYLQEIADQQSDIKLKEALIRFKNSL